MEDSIKDTTPPSETKESISGDISEDNYDIVFDFACELEYGQRFEEAGKAFCKAAVLADSSRLEYIQVVGRYEDAAKCFLQISNDRALTCYMKAADIFVKNGKIEKGIECFVRWGYECGQKFGDMNKAETFYQKADDLRSEHKLSHACVITELENSDFGSDVNQAFKKAEEILEKFRVKVRFPSCIQITHISVCRYCIDSYERLQSHFRHLSWLRKKQKQRKKAIETEKLEQNQREKMLKEEGEQKEREKQASQEKKK